MDLPARLLSGGFDRAAVPQAFVPPLSWDLVRPAQRQTSQPWLREAIRFR
jgi:hypothetical protein